MFRVDNRDIIIYLKSEFGDWQDKLLKVVSHSIRANIGECVELHLIPP